MRHVLWGMIALLLAIAGSACTGGGGRTVAPAPSISAESPKGEESTEDEPLLLPHETVRLYFPSASTDGLVEETREILRTRTPGDRAKQILSDLLAGPGDEEGVSFVPQGTKLRQVFVHQATAYADFSGELKSGLDGGSDAEILTVYSIVNSLALNIPEIDRVVILVEGRPCETLNGHLDLRHPLKPNRKLIFDSRRDGEEKDAKTVVRTPAAPAPEA